jgi:MoaA/NifB/PqqE/SkfB family radical SAM enzyme
MKTVTVFKDGTCNLRCRHCGVGAEVARPRKPLAMADFRRVLSNIAASGVEKITLLGGEPLIDPDIVDVLQECARLGIFVSVNTNMPAAADWRALLRTGALISVIASIDGPTAPSHDRTRGRHAFESLMESLARFHQENALLGSVADIEANVVVSPFNADDCAEMIDFCIANTIPALNVNVVHKAGFARRNFRFDDEHSRVVRRGIETLVVRWALDRDKVRLIIDSPPLVSDYFRRRYGIEIGTNPHACGGTAVYGYVDVKGNHLPCPAIGYGESRKPVMNRRIPSLDAAERRVAEIWDTTLFKGFNRSRVERRYMDQLHPCRTCQYRDKCTPCRSDLMRGEASGVVQLCALFDGEPECGGRGRVRAGAGLP